jgi:outer membrane receptor protein involved in Fe transport
MPDVRGKSYAFYADGTYDVTDRLRILGGIRYTDESKSRYGIGGNWALTLGGANYACCVATRLGTEGFRARAAQPSELRRVQDQHAPGHGPVPDPGYCEAGRA